MKPGHPTTYTDEQAEKICDLVEIGLSVREIAKSVGTPIQTIYEWLWRNAAFSERYTRARQAQAQVWFEKSRELIENEENDILTQPNGTKFCNNAKIGRVREGLNYYKWLMNCCDPYQFGDKLRIEEIKKIEQRLNELETKK